MGVDLVFWVWLIFWCWWLVVRWRWRQLLHVVLLWRRLEPDLGFCRSGLPPTCSYPPEAAAKALTAMLVGSLGNR